MLGEGRPTVTIAHRKMTSIKDSDFHAINKLLPNLPNLRSDPNRKTQGAVTVTERKASGYRIVDLCLDKFIDALDFILIHFFQAEPICKATGLQDDVISVRTYLHLILNKMSDVYSFCAVQEGTGNLVGVLVASVVKAGEHWRTETETYHGETLNEVITWRNQAVAKAQFYETLNVEEFVQIHVICVESNHQSKGIGTSLLRSCVDRARKYCIPACVGEFTSGASQTIAERLDFEVLSEIPYEDFQRQENEYGDFERHDPGNYSIACMALLLKHPIVEPLETPTMSTSTGKSRKKAKTKKKM